MQLPTITPARPELLRTTGAILDFTLQELSDWFEQMGQPRMRARQVRRWLFAGGVDSFDSMTDLPLDLRRQLTGKLTALSTHIASRQAARDHTHKLLVKMRDGQQVECVLIQDAGRRTACVSTQVGCGMGCVFCASGLDGVERNLSSGEILEQLIRLRGLPGPNGPPAQGKPQSLTHIVVMGMGEPLANLDNLLEALEMAIAKNGLGIAARRITISTVGLPKKIRQLADYGKQYHLAVSLHAPNDELRTKIVPTNDKMGIDNILEAAEYFFRKTGRRVTFEYVLLRDLNDRIQHARELARRLKGRQALVNLIPFNDVRDLPYRRPTDNAQAEFAAVLRVARINVKIRKRKGAEIDAACGQLRRDVKRGLNETAGSDIQ